MKSNRSARTPLFRFFKEVIKTCKQLENVPGMGVQEGLELRNFHKFTRREFLGGAAAAALTLTMPVVLSGCSTRTNKSSIINLKNSNVVIVGAGMAGLNAARHFEHAGYQVELYDAANRFGGRMYSAQGLMGAGLTTELGGEFIDSNHADILNLVSEFELQLLDVADDSSAGFKEAFYFEGQLRTEAQVVEAFRPLAKKIEADYQSTEDVVDFQNEGGGRYLDNLNLNQYFDRIGATGWIRKLLEVAYVTEYGLEADEQSALNFVFLVGSDSESDSFAAFGESDERFKIKGGNEMLPRKIAENLISPIYLDQRLESLRSTNNGFDLTFISGNGSVKSVMADYVILTVPFSMLRSVELAVELAPVKKKAIAELSYGTNAKLFVGVNERLWRAANYNGSALSDQSYQLMWDNTQLQGGTQGGLTLYSGGREGVFVGQGSPAEQIMRLMPGVEQTFNGVTARLNNIRDRFHWPSHPFTMGSYAAYRPGQWTTIAGAEFSPQGRLYFAGEHCSYDFQGFMNGAAETGRRAAELIVGKL